MKKLYVRTLQFALIALALTSCSDDSDGIGDGVDIVRDQNFVYFQDDSPISITEGDNLLPVPVLINKRSISDTFIDIEIVDPLGTVGSQNFAIANANGQVKIDANKTFGYLNLVATNDSAFQENRDITIRLLENQSAGLNSGIYGVGIKNEITVTINNDDSFSTIGGNYLAVTTNAFEGGPAPFSVSIPNASVSYTADGFDSQQARFKVSDVTFGFYPERYGVFGAGPVPGIIVHYKSDNSINIVTDESPDPYFGDEFSGSGAFDPSTGKMTIQWSDLYGDKADVSLTPQ